jgi:hypothetical protein
MRLVGLGPFLDEARFALILDAVRGNREAAAFLADCFEVCHFWDDLIDRDKPVTPEYINQSMWRALVHIPRNRFYRAHMDELQPVISSTIINWHTANAMEAERNPDDMPLAFVLRSSYADVIVTAANIVGGPAWASDVALRFRRQVHSETLAGYKKNLEKQDADAARLES